MSAPTDDLGPAAVLASPVRRRLLDTLAHATATSHDLTLTGAHQIEIAGDDGREGLIEARIVTGVYVIAPQPDQHLLHLLRGSVSAAGAILN